VLSTILSKSVLNKSLKKSLLVSSIALVAACGSENESGLVNTDYTAITEDSVPEGFAYESGVSATFYSNEVYGPDERNVFDIYLPESQEPTPLIIFVHGGGFFTGDKSAAYDSPEDINEVLDAGVAFATINYSLLDVPGFNDAEVNDTEGLGKSLSDVKEALQYIRHNATEFNVDPENIAMYGVSAGAISSLWLAYSDDMADLSARETFNASESTRIVAAGAIETQGSMDVVRWEEILESIGVTLEVAAGLTLSLMESVLAIEASDTATSLALMREETGEIADFRATLDIPVLIDNEDPAVFVSNTEVEVDATVAALTRLSEIQVSAPILLGEYLAALSVNDIATADVKYQELSALQTEGASLAPGIIGALLHFPTHPKAIVDAAAAAGATVVANIPELELPEPTGQTVIPFLLEELDAVQP
jgi:hypothetical protein